MKNKKYLLFAVIPIAIVAMMWLLTQAFHLISARSDSAVLYGFLLFGGTLTLAAYTITYFRNHKI